MWGGGYVIHPSHADKRVEHPHHVDANNTLFPLSQQDSLSQQKRDCDRSTIVVTDDVADKATDSVAVLLIFKHYTTMKKQNETVASVQNAQFAEADNVCTIRVTRCVPNTRYTHLLNVIGKSNNRVLKYALVGEERELSIIENSSMVSDVYIGSIVDKIVDKNPLYSFLYNMLEKDKEKIMFILPYLSLKVAQYQLKEGVEFTSPIDGEVRIPTHDTIKNYIVDVITHDGFNQIMDRMLNAIFQQ